MEFDGHTFNVVSWGDNFWVFSTFDIKLNFIFSGRNSTTAVTTDGRVFVWGRNDKNQLGLGVVKSPTNAVRKILLKAPKGPKTVELPEDNNVAMPTLIPGLYLPIHKGSSNN